MRRKILLSYTELETLLTNYNSVDSTPALVMIQSHPNDIHSLENITKYKKSLTIISEDINQPEGTVNVITSDGYVLNESSINI